MHGVAGGMLSRPKESPAKSLAIKEAAKAWHPSERPEAVHDITQWLNREHVTSRGEDVDDLNSRIASYELAFRMQSAVPEAVDLSRESTAMRQRYGMDGSISPRFGRGFLLGP